MTATATMDIENNVTIPTVEESRPPRTHVDSSPLPTDSMVTVPLSEAGTNDDDDVRESIIRPEIIVEERRLSSRPDSEEIYKAFGRRGSQASIAPTSSSPTVSVDDVDAMVTSKSMRSRSGSESSGDAKVNWAELDKKETQQPHEGQDDVGSTFCWHPDHANTCRQWPYCSHASNRRIMP